MRVIPGRCLPNLLLKNSSDGALTVSLGNLLQCFAVPVIKMGFLIANLQLKAMISHTTHHRADLYSQTTPTKSTAFSSLDHLCQPTLLFGQCALPWQ